MGTVTSVLVWDCEVHTQLVVDIVDEKFLDSSDGTEDTTVVASNVGVVNIVTKAVLGSCVSDKELGAATLTDCLDTDCVTNVLVVDGTEDNTLIELDVTCPIRYKETILTIG